MTRGKLYVRGLGIGYIAMGANIAYSLISIPLALGYLGKQQFGLWAVVLQVVSYMQMLDLGISNGFSRILIDEKDNRSSGAFCSTMLTGALAQAIIGSVIALAGWIGGPLLARLMTIPPELSADFVLLIGTQSTILGLAVSTRMLGAPFYAYQRQDILGIGQIGLFVVYLAALYLGLLFGLGLYAMVLSSASGLVWSTVFNIVLGYRLKLFPSRNEWSAPSWQRFQHVFGYSKNIFLMGLGWQILNGSPILVISRSLGLDAAAAWSVCNKPFQILLQFLSRPADNAYPVFTEMYVRNELPKLRSRFQHLFQLTASASVAGCISLAVVNPSFIAWWTGGRIAWPPINHASLALLVMVYSILRIPNGFVGVTKQFGALKYSYFIEGIVFVGLSLYFVKLFGIASVPVTAAVCHILISSRYGLKYFTAAVNLPVASIVHWLSRPLAGMIILSIIGYFVFRLSENFSAFYALGFRLAAMAAISILVILSVSLPPSVRSEVLKNLKKAKGR